jgi:hypothetical protein
MTMLESATENYNYLSIQIEETVGVELTDCDGENFTV